MMPRDLLSSRAGLRRASRSALMTMFDFVSPGLMVILKPVSPVVSRIEAMLAALFVIVSRGIGKPSHQMIGKDPC